MAQNIFLSLELHTKKAKSLEDIVSKVTQSNKLDKKEKIRDLVSLIVEGSYEKRASQQKLTGEWIIYAKYQSKNYYLTLAQHDEGDDVIHQRIIEGCQADFPFLFGNSEII